MMRTLAAIMVIAGPALAQDPEWPPFDAALVDACLSQAQERAGSADTPNYASCIGAASGPCMASPDGETTVGMSHCLGKEYDLWDAKLNASYARAMAGAEATDAEMAGMGSAAEKQAPLLKRMQRDWIAFRDSACSYEGSRWGGGSGAGPASVDCMLQLTAEQYLRLRAWEPRDE